MATATVLNTDKALVSNRWAVTTSGRTVLLCETWRQAAILARRIALRTGEAARAVRA